MKRRGDLLVVFGLIFIFSFSFASALCSGTATLCSDFAREASCKAQQGCSWPSTVNSSVLTGAPIVGLCSGTATLCSDFAETNSCNAQAGCVWANETSCTDSDGGKDYYVKGVTDMDDWNESFSTDKCESGKRLREYYCKSDNSGITSENYECSRGCLNGACVKSNFSYDGTCSELVNQIADPTDFEKQGINYTLQWKYFYNLTWFFNKSEYNFTEYYASWRLNYNKGDDYRYGYLQKSVMVFDDESFDTLTILEDMTKRNFCQIHSYDNEGVYVCNWNVYKRGVDIDQSNWKWREILWNNGNVLARFSVGFGEQLTDAEISKLVEKETMKFINSLKDNQGKYIGWENFDLDWPFSNQMFDSLEICSSDVPQTACSPSWNCIIEPVICPEHGFQTQTCQDYSCDNEDIISQMSCNPGICSGCLVPKWFESRGLGNNKCIPYGFRFENQIGWNIEEQTSGGLEKLTVGEANKTNMEVNLSISSDELATLEVEGWGNKTYTFRQGDNVTVDVSGWGEAAVSLSFVATEIVYDTENYEDSYVTFEFTYVYLGQTEDKINAYCDIDGYVKPQKTKKGGEWAKCQNNYECDSNLCSSGECVELKDIAGEASAFKTIVVKFFCRITHLLSNENYDQCLIDSGVNSG